MNKVNTTIQKVVFFKDSNLNYTPYDNLVVNHKYNIFTFIPIVIFNQFKFFGNLFYLVMTVSLFFDIFKVGFLFSYLSPLVIVIIVTMVKEAYDDIKRHIQDRNTNNEEYLKYSLSSTNKRKSSSYIIKSKVIKIGDIIEIGKNQRIPADMVLLKSVNENGNNNLFIRTDQLDGEADWKLRKSPSCSFKKSIYDMITLEGCINYIPPSKNIYSFEGVINFVNHDGTLQKESLNLENTLWASTILASEKAIGIVIYTGKETRVQMNSSAPKIKFGILDFELNYLNKLLFGIMVILSGVITLFKKCSVYYSIIIFSRYIVLFCGIIPISLRVNLDISKTFFSYLINKDKTIEGTKVNNSTIPEELGRITYVFSDKTGTLTKNEMVFRKIAMENDLFSEESFNDLSLILSDECKASPAPLYDLVVTQNRKVSASSSSIQIFLNENKKKPKRKRRNRNKLIRDAISAMALCNNVTPIFDEKDPNKISYQASSPDEVALVQFANQLNMKLIHRTDTEIIMVNANFEKEEYEILANFPFSSDSKRMGIVLKNKTFGHIIFYLKGAENVVEKFVKEKYKGYIKENAENLAMAGLRTLVLTQKLLSQEEFDEWKSEYHEAFGVFKLITLPPGMYLFLICCCACSLSVKAY